MATRPCSSARSGSRNWPNSLRQKRLTNMRSPSAPEARGRAETGRGSHASKKHVIRSFEAWLTRSLLVGVAPLGALGDEQVAVVLGVRLVLTVDDDVAEIVLLAH